MSCPVTIELSGGAELLFDNQKKHEVVLPENSNPWTIKTLLPWVRDNLLKERPELFMQGETVRPGILVLVNDADWELMGSWITVYSQMTGLCLYLHYMEDEILNDR